MLPFYTNYTRPVSLLIPNKLLLRYQHLLAPLKKLKSVNLNAALRVRMSLMSDATEFDYLLESSQSYAQHMPNPLRKKSGGRLVLSVPLIIFIDDVSGNVSKQWNKHHVVYMSNAAMPRQMLEKEFCVRFVSSSPHASPLELAKGVKDSIMFVICLSLPRHSY